MIFCQKQELKNNQGHTKTGAINDVMKRDMADSRLFSRMLVMRSPADSQPKHGSGLRACWGVAIEHPKPPEVGIEVLGGHALEAAHPPAQPTDKGVDVLHMPGPAHAE